MKTALVTIGQSPRDDLVPELLPYLPSAGAGIAFDEVGALDGLSAAEIAAMAPAAGEERLCTRLRDGSQAVIGKPKTVARLNRIFAELDASGYGLIVLLCTGYFEGLHCRALFLEAQRLVDGFVAAVALDGRKVGVLVPLAEQIVQHEVSPTGYAIAGGSHASPYEGDRLDAAARELAGMDLIVMHCMGYTEEMARRVQEVSGRPVVLSRRVIAAGWAQFVR